MAKFELTNLPKCGAKTRTGSPCQRYGNKINGRCKLHGGRSTGAKTKEGKLAVRVNALLNGLAWFCDNQFYVKIKVSDADKGIKAYLQLTDLLELEAQERARQVFRIVDECHVELEMIKYYISERCGPTALLIIQAALDHYYKDCDSQHLHFHVHTPLFPAPFFHNYFGSKAEDEMMKKTLIKSLKKQGIGYSPRPPVSPTQRELKRRVKALQAYAKSIE